MPVEDSTTCDVAIIGAGPVGLLLASLLGQRGVTVRVLEKRTAPRSHSQAIGITPPSLEILEGLGLADAFVSHGVKMRECFVHGDTGPVGVCSFRDLPGKFPFILSLPQQVNVILQERNMEKYPQVSVLRGVEVGAITSLPQEDHVSLQCGASVMTARYVVACDGWRSGVRERLDPTSRSRKYDSHFLMGDFTDRSGLGDEAHLFFTADGAVESFPLPGGIRRWIVQTESHLEPTVPDVLQKLVRRRSGFDLPAADQLNQTSFTPQRLNCTRLYHDRVILCGDSAHVMSPIGGQGMNTGFADAAHLARTLTAILRNDAPANPALAAYDHTRRRAASTAATRAAWGMGLGTWRGDFKSRLRDFLLSELLLTGRAGALLAKHYAMMA